MKLFTISVSSLSTRDFTNLITLAVSFNRVVIFV
nr:CPXV058 protein [Cowpox virus]